MANTLTSKEISLLNTNQSISQRKIKHELDEEGYMQIMIATMQNQGLDDIDQSELMGMIAHMGTMKATNKMENAISKWTESQEKISKQNELHAANRSKGKLVLATPTEKCVRQAKDHAIRVAKSKGLKPEEIEKIGKDAETLARKSISGVIQNARIEDDTVIVELKTVDGEIMKIPYINITEFGDQKNDNQINQSKGQFNPLTSLEDAIYDTAHQVKNETVDKLKEKITALLH